MKSVILGDWGTDLLCPECGCNNLHQGMVSVYNRTEDAERTQVVKVSVGVLTCLDSLSDGCGNPSSRRHGLRIAMVCEQCPCGYDLVLYQHKGTTFMGWETKSR